MVFPWQRKKRVNAALKRYREGIRLMRQGDGADEWIGMSLAREGRDALNKLGYDVDGTRPDLKKI